VTPVKRTKRLIAALAVAGTLMVVAPIAQGTPSPPTNGGNGAGQSGQCTGNPADRPAVCPAT
jgi:hypothetical protein